MALSISLWISSQILILYAWASGARKVFPPYNLCVMAICDQYLLELPCSVPLRHFRIACNLHSTHRCWFDLTSVGFWSISLYNLFTDVPLRDSQPWVEIRTLVVENYLFSSGQLA